MELRLLALLALATPSLALETHTSVEAARQRSYADGLVFIQQRLIHTTADVSLHGLDAFEEIDGGKDRVCRGTSRSDDDASYYSLHGGSAATSLEACKVACVGTSGCRGLEFRPGRCEIWTRSGGIGATAVTAGAVCLRYVPFISVAGGNNRACRGDSPSDNSPAHYRVLHVDSLEACHEQCLGVDSCVGIEYASGRCEIWTRAAGIGSSIALAGSLCQHLAPFTLVDGGSDRACRGRDTTDSSPTHYIRYGSDMAPSLDSCKELCAKDARCKGIEYSDGNCEVWTRVSGIGATAALPGALCLRYKDVPGSEDAFRDVDGGSGRSCRGHDHLDYDQSYFDFYPLAAAPRSLETCKALCIQTPTCKGIEFSEHGCKVWTRPGGILASVGITGFTCLRYDPFMEVDGGNDRACTGDEQIAFSLEQVGTLERCKTSCIGWRSCRGLDFNPATGCRLWTQAIAASLALAGSTCLRYAPFSAAEGGMDRSCRGADASDTWNSNYASYNSSQISSLASCKALCIETAGCKGIEYDVNSCKVWSRRGGIQTTVDRSGSLCLRLGPFDPWDASNAFMAVDGGEGRACGGDTKLYSKAFGLGKVTSLETCQTTCIDMPGCRGVGFGPEGCEIWLGPGTMNVTIAEESSVCLRYEPFRDVDGGIGRDCRGSDENDSLDTNFVQRMATSLQACQDFCSIQSAMSMGSDTCKGISYDADTALCLVWTRPEGIGATAPAEQSVMCQRYEPFMPVDGGKNRACRGVHSDESTGGYKLFDMSEVSSLDSCRKQCVATPGCRGIEYSSLGCKVWHQQISTSVHFSGSVCLKYGHASLAEIAEKADVFQAIDGGTGRACRGDNMTDNSPSHYTYYHPSKITSMAACQGLCVQDVACHGIEFSVHGCKIWKRLIGATATSPDLTCLRHEPFALFNGLADQACRGGNVHDNRDINFLVFTGSAAPSLQDCKVRCLRTLGCKGVEYTRSRCEIWIRPRGIEASVPLAGATCLTYEPFLKADGGLDRACRGSDSSDLWSSYYTSFDDLAWGSGTSFDACKRHCTNTAGCKGLEYTRNSCKIWTRPGGIGTTVYREGALCLRFGAWDPLELMDSFLAVDGGEGRACRGLHANDISSSYYVTVGPSKATSLEICKGLCMSTPGCSAVQYSQRGCNVWTRLAGVEASVAEAGTTCLRFEPFRAVDGGSNRACESAEATSEHSAQNLAECKYLCRATAGCHGASFNEGSCQLMLGAFGTEYQQGSTCLSFQPFMGIDGGRDRACRGMTEEDDSADHYIYYDSSQVSSLEACKATCVQAPVCMGVEYSKSHCKVWTRQGGIRSTVREVGSLCIRYGEPDASWTASAFQEIDGGRDRACRGANLRDNAASYYTLYLDKAESESMDACQNECMRTAGCKGVEFRDGGCEVWTISTGIQATVAALGRSCLRYTPFTLVNGFADQACRGSTSTDNDDSYYLTYSPEQAPSLEDCQNLCISTHGCKGIEYRGWCEVWTRPAGIGAVAVSPGTQCFRYEPFSNVDGGANRACRGADPQDSWGSYYSVYGPGEVASLDACKAFCMSTLDCKGIEYRDSRCEVWTRRAGIGSSAASSGSLCLRYGYHDSAAAADAFTPAFGGQNRACRGSTATDDHESYYDWFGPAWVTTLEECKALCISTQNCKGVDFSSQGCKIWTRDDGIGSTAYVLGATCLIFNPFEPVDGGKDRACRGHDVNDAGNYIFFDHAEAPSLQVCEDRCRGLDGCKGISFGTNGCQVWTHQDGIRSTSPESGSTCMRYEPFMTVDGGKDRSCRGANENDASVSHYFTLPLSDVATLEACRLHCVGASGCVGVEFSVKSGCHIWTRRAGITATQHREGSICLRYGPPDPLRAADAFVGAHGGMDRACRGSHSGDNSASYWNFYTRSVVPSLEACKLRCIWTPGCRGIEFNPYGCEVWTRGAGIGTTVSATGYSCFHYKPFRSADGFNGRACRGENITDFTGTGYYTHYSKGGVYDGSLASCERLCSKTPGCKGIERGDMHCEVWTRPRGIGATAPSGTLSCLRYEPFTNVDGGINRACRGADSSDNWPSYYSVTTTSSINGCKELCMKTAGCQGVEYNRKGRCEIWTRTRGIGSSVELSDSVCLRYGSWDPSEVIDGFLPADGGSDRACRGEDETDMNSSHYTAYSLDLAPTLDACKAICTITPGCKGIEYSKFNCEVWTRSSGIQATAAVRGFKCFRYEAFEAVDGGSGRACRGADVSDASPSHFTFHGPEDVSSLEVCKALCVTRPGCKGISYSDEGCEVWTRSLGIQTTVAQVGSACFRHEPFTAADGGKDRACRGAQPWDNSTTHFRPVSSPVSSLAKCKASCVSSPGCRGIEYKEGSCLIWTRPGGIDATATSPGSTCLRYGATQAGSTEEGERRGHIHVASNPSLCLDVADGSAFNGNTVRLWTCEDSSNQLFLLMSDSSAQIRWAAHPNMCLDVAAGLNSNGTRIQIWECQVPASRNMQFLLPDSGIGQIRWATYNTMCLDAQGAEAGSLAQLWSCRGASTISRLVLPPGQLLTVHQTKYVAHYLPWFLGNNVNEACTRAGESCPYKNDHWCSAYGNSYYSSYLGAYDITGSSNVIDLQLDLMKSVGLDGLWIDYQMSTWDDVVDRLVAGLKMRGMGFAIMVDSATFPNVMAETAAKVARWTQEPHYYRHQGIPIVPVWNNNDTIFTPLPVTAIYISRFEFEPPEWASDTYTWVQDDYLVRYYEQDHPVVSSGSAFRGYRDCYLNKTLQEPDVSLLQSTLRRARDHRPEYVQLATWNDYTEGTQLEPSWLRREGECVDVCGENCPLIADCHSYGRLTDCSKPLGMPWGPADPSCNVTGNLSAFADINRVRQHIRKEKAYSRALALAASRLP